MGNDTIYTNTIVRKKARENDVTSCAVTSGHVTSVHVTSISHATSRHAQLCICYICYSKKKSAGKPFRTCAEHTSGYDVTSGHVTSYQIRAASDDVTSSNAYTMARSPLLPLKYSLSCTSSPQKGVKYQL